MTDRAGNDVVADGFHPPAIVPPRPKLRKANGTELAKANGHGVGRVGTGANIAFDRFFAIYPNKDDPGLAAMKFHAARKLADVDVEDIIAGAERYAAERAGEDPQYMQKAHNWLMARAWENAPKPKRSNSHRSSSVIDDFGGLEGWVRAALDEEKPQ
jgi:hypothetical protein